jgi:hypothetical protein
MCLSMLPVAKNTVHWEHYRPFLLPVEGKELHREHIRVEGVLAEGKAAGRLAEMQIDGGRGDKCGGFNAETGIAE